MLAIHQPDNLHARRKRRVAAGEPKQQPEVCTPQARDRYVDEKAATHLDALQPCAEDAGLPGGGKVYKGRQGTMFGCSDAATIGETYWHVSSMLSSSPRGCGLTSRRDSWL